MDTSIQIKRTKKKKLNRIRKKSKSKKCYQFKHIKNRGGFRKTENFKSFLQERLTFLPSSFSPEEAVLNIFSGLDAIETNNPVSFEKDIFKDAPLLESGRKLSSEGKETQPREALAELTLGEPVEEKYKTYIKNITQNYVDITSQLDKPSEIRKNTYISYFDTHGTKSDLQDLDFRQVPADTIICLLAPINYLTGLGSQHFLGEADFNIGLRNLTIEQYEEIFQYREKIGMSYTTTTPINSGEFTDAIGEPSSLYLFHNCFKNSSWFYPGQIYPNLQLLISRSDLYNILPYSFESNFIEASPDLMNVNLTTPLEDIHGFPFLSKQEISNHIQKSPNKIFKTYLHNIVEYRRKDTNKKIKLVLLPACRDIGHPPNLHIYYQLETLNQEVINYYKIKNEGGVSRKPGKLSQTNIKMACHFRSSQGFLTTRGNSSLVPFYNFKSHPKYNPNYNHNIPTMMELIGKQPEVITKDEYQYIANFSLFKLTAFLKKILEEKEDEYYNSFIQQLFTHCTKILCWNIEIYARLLRIDPIQNNDIYLENKIVTDSIVSNFKFLTTVINQAREIGIPNQGVSTLYYFLTHDVENISKYENFLRSHPDFEFISAGSMNYSLFSQRSKKLIFFNLTSINQSFYNCLNLDTQEIYLDSGASKYIMIDSQIQKENQIFNITISGTLQGYGGTNIYSSFLSLFPSLKTLKLKNIVSSADLGEIDVINFGALKSLHIIDCNANLRNIQINSLRELVLKNVNLDNSDNLHIFISPETKILILEDIKLKDRNSISIIIDKTAKLERLEIKNLPPNCSLQIPFLSTETLVITECMNFDFDFYVSTYNIKVDSLLMKNCLINKEEGSKETQFLDVCAKLRDTLHLENVSFVDSTVEDKLIDILNKKNLKKLNLDCEMLKRIKPKTFLVDKIKALANISLINYGLDFAALVNSLGK